MQNYARTLDDKCDAEPVESEDSAEKQHMSKIEPVAVLHCSAVTEYDRVREPVLHEKDTAPQYHFRALKDSAPETEVANRRG